MFKSITLENFFSFGKSTKIELNPDVNILVGINGSGKSNFIRAIELLYEGVANRKLESLINRKWGGSESICHFHPSMNQNLKLGFEFRGKAIDDYHNEQKQSRISGMDDYFFFNPVYEVAISAHKGATYSLSESYFSADDLREQNLLPSEESHQELLFANAESNDQNQLDRMRKVINNLAIYGSFDTGPESNTRRITGFYTETKLLANGENLTTLLTYIQANHALAFDKITESLREVNPNFKELVFWTPVSGKTMLTLKEKHLGRTVPVEFISDGTLRFLLLLAILYNPKRGAVVCLDEPEMGLHPDMINSVAQGIKYAAQNGTQMIVSTHSPLLLNSFELEDLLIFEKDEENQTVVKRKSEEDFKDWEGEFLAGQMWLRGQLGGVRW
jgi:predicted ATPase